VNATGAAPLICGASIVVAMSAACGPKRVAGPAPARVQVVLLADPDSETPSAATVTNALGNVGLTEPFETTNVLTNRPPTPPVKMEETEVLRQFGGVLADLPAAARHFNLYFKSDSSELTDESRALLPEVLRAVAARKVPEVTVIGHTDTSGSAGTNYKLGLERAQTVRALLLTTGLATALVDVESHGENDLLRKTPDNTAEPTNRRVEITIR
jgi:outer membrane protein OmpA-like peptidoglycan-associated protein